MGGNERSALGSWLNGPGVPAAPSDAAGESYRGERLGLPRTGAGSVAGFGVRVAALFADWFASILVALLIARGDPPYGSDRFSLIVLAVFAVEVWLLTWLSGGSFGQVLLRLRVGSLADRPVGPLRALVRTLLLCLVVPAVIYDRDGRGMHDRATASVVVRSR